MAESTTVFVPEKLLHFVIAVIFDTFVDADRYEQKVDDALLYIKERRFESRVFLVS
jgi:hypothetical protein